MLTLLTREDATHPWRKVFQAEELAEVAAERRKHLSGGTFGNNLYTLSIDADRVAETIERMNRK